MTTFLKQIQDLGLEIMITELDVDDVDVPGPLIDQTVASKYGEFIDFVGPYVKVITFEQLRDDPSLPKRPMVFRIGLICWTPSMNRPKPSATVKALRNLAKG